MSYCDKWLKYFPSGQWPIYLGWLAIFSLPWQTRWIILDHSLAGLFSEYSRISLYGSTILILLTLIVLVINKKFQRPNWLYFLPLLWIILSFIWTKDYLMTGYYGLVWLVAVMVLLIVQSLPRKIVINALICAGILQALIALAQFSLQYIPASSWLGWAEHRPEVLGQSVVIIEGLRYLRAYGSLPHPNMLAGFLTVVYLLLIIFRQQFLPQKKSLFIWLFFIGLCTLGLVVTFSRAAWLATVVGLIIYLLISCRQRDWFAVRKIILAVVVSLGIIAGCNLTSSAMLTARVDISSRLEQKSVSERIVGLEQSWNIIKQPATFLLGTAVGGYLPAVIKQAPGLTWYDYQPVHNIYLFLLSEWGLIGLIILFISGLAYWQGRRSSGELIVIFTALFIIGLLDHWLMSSYFGLLLCATLLGLSAKKTIID